MCNFASPSILGTSHRSALHSIPDTAHTDALPPALHPPALDDRKLGLVACPPNLPIPLLHTEPRTAETSDHISPKSLPLVPASIASLPSSNISLKIASPGSPAASLSVSSVTSIGDSYNPVSLCAKNRTYHLLPTEDCMMMYDEKFPLTAMTAFTYPHPA